MKNNITNKLKKITSYALVFSIVFSNFAFIPVALAEETPETIADTTAPSVSSYTLNGEEQNVVFNPNESASVSIVVNANEPVKFTRIKILDSANEQVKFFTEMADFVTTASEVWDGKNADGVVVPDGVYTLQVNIKDAAENANNNFNLAPYTITVDTADTPAPSPLSSAKAITAFDFTEPITAGVIDESAHTISIIVPNGTVVTALVSNIAVSNGASISPNTGIAKDFTNPVIYTVTAEDGGTQEYAVTVTVVSLPDLELLATPSTVPSGQSAIISWSSTNTDNCTAYENGNPARDKPEKVNITGSFTQTFYESKTYTFTCEGTGGHTTKSITVTMTAPPSSGGGGGGGGNRPPVISGVDSPTVLNVNETGSWAVRASDPENGNLSYSVVWGDEQEIMASKSLGASLGTEFVQTATFTHSYAEAGTYTPTFTVQDNAGQTAQTSVTVRVEDVQPLTDEQIIENLATLIQLNLCPPRGAVCDKNFDLNNDGGVTSADQLIILNVLSLSDAQFDIVYVKILTMLDVQSDDLGTINSRFVDKLDANQNGQIDRNDKERISRAIIGTRPYAPSISITSPDGGEFFRANDTVKIQWTVVGSVDTTDRIFLISESESGSKFNFGHVIARAGSFDWTIPFNYQGRYKILISEDAEGNEPGDILDASDFFTITAQPPLTNSEILANIATVIRNHPGTVLTPADSPNWDWDIYGENHKVDLLDQQVMRVLGNLSDLEYQLVYEKVLNAIRKRQCSPVCRTTSDKYEPLLDFNNDGLILVDDVDMARNAMDATRTQITLEAGKIYLFKLPRVYTLDELGLYKEDGTGIAGGVLTTADQIITPFYPTENPNVFSYKTFYYKTSGLGGTGWHSTESAMTPNPVLPNEFIMVKQLETNPSPVVWTYPEGTVYYGEATSPTPTVDSMRWLNDFKQAYPPIESVMNMAPRKNIPAPLLIDKLLNNAQETTGRAVTLTSVDPVSEKGGSISRTDTYVIYMPPVDYLGEDSFKYTITVDGGRTAEILVKINVTEQTFIQPLSKTPLDNGKVLVKFITLPHRTISILVSADKINWTSLGTATSNQAGQLSIEDIASETERYYLMGEKPVVTSFSFPSGTGIINETAHTIAATVPFGTDVRALVSTFITTGASVSVGKTWQVSGVTANDFTSPVTYRVTAENGTVEDYVVTVTVAPQSSGGGGGEDIVQPFITLEANKVYLFKLPRVINFDELGFYKSDGTGLAGGSIVTADQILSAYYPVGSSFTSTKTYYYKTTAFGGTGWRSAESISATASAPESEFIFIQRTETNPSPVVWTYPEGTIYYGEITFHTPTADSERWENDFKQAYPVLTATQTAPDDTGVATVNDTTPEVVITGRTSTTTVTISSGTTNPKINVRSFITGGTGTLPAINITSANANNANVAIPASTVVTSASTTWDGVIAAPTVTTVTLPETSGQTTTLSTAIEVGFAGAKLSFDKAVRILLPGQAGKKAGFVRDGIAFTEITAVCAADNQATGDGLAPDGECKIDVGADLVIWTKHFTTFATYTQTVIPPVVVPPSGGGGGGGGGGILVQPSTLSSAAQKVDTNKDNKVDMLDLVVVMANWNKNGAGNIADFNNDSKVDILDFVELLVNWSK